MGSRYYDPEVKRFISADDIGVVSLDSSSLYDKNLYAYCDNNPVTREDDNGYSWIVSAVVGGLFNVAFSVFTSSITGEEITTKGLIFDFVLGAASTGNTIVKVGVAFITGSISADKEYSKSKSLTKALSVGTISGITSVCTIGNKLERYLDDVGIVTKKVISSIFDTGQNLSVFAINNTISSLNNKDNDYYANSRKRGQLFYEIYK